MVTVATQDERRSEEENPHYISSDVKLQAYDEESLLNYGPVWEETDVDAHDDIEAAYVTFFGIPVGSLVRIESRADGYKTGFSEVYVDTGVGAALHDDESRFSAGEATQGYEAYEDGFTTSCSFDVDDDFYYYDCFVVDEYGVSGGYYLFLSHHDTDEQLYAEFIVSNKLSPDEQD